MVQEEGPASIAARFADAWNRHDMAAFAALFHVDASFVNRFGTYWRGVEQIVAGHAPIHETIYSDSTLTNEVADVDPISDDAAILHIWSRLSAGAAHPVGPHRVDTMILAVVTRRDGAWKIQALENVTLVNPRTGEPILRD
ncbi:SgcJ/EcaC family oxidoreductase [Sphingopyxis sp. DBS4]|uniref:SgcJ/EcaC family oxidoreductase n=1 Tax=Sphingopyxis sp. DBS4 TaxID=2968500 RepID=UPI00214C940C|nr:SgcJ/EcaC family oxidoreductase [Sphingopyxis sp. DBS4]